MRGYKIIVNKKVVALIVSASVVFSGLIGGIVYYHHRLESNAFISVWDTTNTSTNTASIIDSKKVSLPLESLGTYSFVVDWGDGLSDKIIDWNQLKTTHIYSSEGNYTIKITGLIIGWRFNNGGDRLKLIEIKQWGDLKLGNSGNYFDGCSNLKISATDFLNLNNTWNLFAMFRNCYKIDVIPNIGNWDVSKVINMGYMFCNTGFDHSIDKWNVSNVIDMGSMFSGSNFNQPIGNWDVSNVTNMGYLFSNSRFNQPIDNWDVSKVMIMEAMFFGAELFNQSLNNWNVSKVTNMGHMFCRTSSFNQPLDNWDVSKVTYTSFMFSLAGNFNQPLDNWDVSNVRDMFFMFYKDLNFNQPLDRWDVSNVKEMSYMFSSAVSFDQDLGNWDIISVSRMYGMFSGVTLSTSNYNSLLNGWSQLKLKNNISFDAGNSKYSTTAFSAREKIISDFNWTIFDGGSTA